MLATFIFIVAMFITMVLIPPLMKSAARFSFIDVPDERKVHKSPIPRVGGIAMIAGAVTPILIWVQQPRDVIAFLLGVGVILGFGVWDDRRNLNFRYKFFGQALAVGIVVFYGDIYIKYLPLCGLDPIPYGVSVPLTFFALMGITNAINLADGLDGLAGGTTFISMAALSLLAYLAKDFTVLLLSTAVMGAIVGFLRFNTFPAQIFMGDAGSQFLGFSAGVLVLLLTQKGNPALSAAMPLLLLGLPILDTFIVMGQRIYEKRSPFSPDRNHIHHKLISLGYDHYEAVVLIYVAQTVLVSAAVYFRYESDVLNLMLFGGFSLATILLFQALSRAGWRAHKTDSNASPSLLARSIRRAKDSGRITTISRAFIAMFLPGYVLFAISNVDSLPYDATLTVFVMLAVAIALLVLYRERRGMTLIERLIICTTITASMYYYIAAPHRSVALVSIENGFFVLLMLAIIASYRFAKGNEFRVTPMDFLVLFAVLIVPNMLGEELVAGDIGEVAAKSVLLYYAAEMLMSQTKNKELGIRLASVAVLGVFTAQALW